MTTIRRLPVVAVVLLLLLGTVVATRPVPARADLQPAAGQYVPLTPARIYSAQSIPAAGVFSFSPLGKGGIPASGVSAIAFNLTASGTGTGHLTAYPAATTRPGTSTVNYRPNLNIANAAVVALGTGSQVSIYNSSADTPVNVYVDVTGYFSTAVAGTAGSTYVPLTPARIASALAVTAGGTIAVAPLGLGGIPAANVSAVLAHLTVTSSAAGSVGVYPDGVTRPVSSNVNYRDDPAYTNSVPITLGANGRFRIYSNQAATVTVDVVGYYQAPAGTAAGGSYVGLTPARVLSNVTLGAGATASYPLTGTGGIPASGVAAAAFNLTATGATSTGALTVWAADVARPVARLLSYRVGGTWTTLQVSKLSPDGRISIYNSGSAPIRLYLDVSGYYRKAAVPGAPTAVVAESEDGQANVSWTRPASDGGAAITSYRVTAAPGGATVDVVDTTGAVFAGLTNGTAYTFTVSAANAVGRSPESSPSAAVAPAAPTAPGAPAGVTATARFGSARVSWQRPANDGRLTLDTYTVTASPGGATVTVAAPTTEAEVPNLTNGTAYTFTVKAANSLGTGPASAASAAVTPVSTVPDPPGGVLAAADGDGAVAVDWTAPAYTGGSAVTGYTVVAQPGGKTVTTAANVLAASVTGLTAGTAYTFAVTARTAQGTSTATTSKPTKPDLALAAGARQLSAAALGTLTAVTDTTLVFTGAPAEVTGLPVGAVLVVPAATAAPDGFLRTVSRVVTSGTTTTVTTTDAALTDAFTDGGFGFSGTLPATAPDTGEVTTKAFTPQQDFLVQDWEIVPGVTASGKIHVGVKFDGTANLHPTELTVSADPEIKTELSLTATQKAEFKERKLRLGSTDFKITKGSKFFRPNFVLNFYLVATGSLEAGFKTEGSMAKSVGATVVLTDPGKSSLRNSAAVSEFKQPNFFGKGNLQLGVRMEVVGELYSKDIAKLHLDGYYDNTVEPTGNPWWKVDDCVRGGAELVPFFDRSAFKNDELFEPLCRRVAGADGALSELDMNPREINLARGGTADFTAKSKYLTNDTVTWAVEGTDSGTITSAGRYTAPARDGVFTVTATMAATLTRPSQSGKVVIHVGAPGPPTISAYPNPARPAGVTVPIVGLSVDAATGPATDRFIVTWDPIEQGSPCNGQTILTFGSANYTITDSAFFGTNERVQCHMFIPGHTYTFLVLATNQYGNSPVVRSNPVTILPPPAAAAATTATRTTAHLVDLN